MTFTEADLVSILWKSETAKNKMLTLWKGESKPSKQAIMNLTGVLPPGTFTTLLLTDVGRSIESRKGVCSFKLKTRTMGIEQVKEHIAKIRDPSFDPSSYKEKGYILSGTIQTDGFRLNLLAFKVKELQCARYKRLPDTVLPDRLTSTCAGVNYHLTEIRNIVKTKEDVEKIWDCEPDQIKVLGIDLGQAYTVGASAILPGDIVNGTQRTFHNLTVKQKAVYQPTFKFRRWLESKKRQKSTDGTLSISEIESSLPPIKGENASIEQYSQELEKSKEALYEFYSGNNNIVNRNMWDAKKARQREYMKIADSLLKMIGGAIGKKVEKGFPAVIGIGLGQFKSNTRLSSLHESFLSFFVQKVSNCLVLFDTT